MTETITPAGIADVMAHLLDRIRAVGKNERANIPNAQFNFRGIDAVLNAVGPHLREVGAWITSELVSVDYAVVETSKAKASGACRLVVTYTIHAPDGTSTSSTVAAESWDTGDKGTSKAMSVALRTFLIQTLALPTDEPDPDLYGYERATPEERAEQERIERQHLVNSCLNAVSVAWKDSDADRLAGILEEAKARGIADEPTQNGKALGARIIACIESVRAQATAEPPVEG